MPSNATAEANLRAEIVRVGQLLYQKEFIVSGDGNISARLDDTHILCTPSGLCKGFMRPAELLIINLDGQRVDTPTPENARLRPTSEMAMHLEVYRNRSDVRAVVHAHPPTAVALSIAGVSLAECMLPEVIVTLGLIATTPYSTPSSTENAIAIRNAIRNHNGIILQRHGSLAVGHNPVQAFQRTETIEQIARIVFMVNLMGGGEPLPAYQVEKLLAQRDALGLSLPEEGDEFCAVCGATHPQAQTCAAPQIGGDMNEPLVAEITRRVMEKLSIPPQ